MASNDAYGRAFLGECGGSLYGEVDMHQNTLKNLPEPNDNGDAVNKIYVDTNITELFNNTTFIDGLLNNTIFIDAMATKVSNLLELPKAEGVEF